ncbi:hypothetical protein, partial [Planktothrix sp.]|uniref:hypothetical protein n=1 Tax=Planktothrix sp. TaxID=3088171 RepID=UPI0038D4495E
LSSSEPLFLGFAIAFPTHQSCSFVVVFFLKAVFLLAIAPPNCSILFRISYNNHLDSNEDNKQI